MWCHLCMFKITYLLINRTWLLSRWDASKPKFQLISTNNNCYLLTLQYRINLQVGWDYSFTQSYSSIKYNTATDYFNWSRKKRWKYLIVIYLLNKCWKHLESQRLEYIRNSFYPQCDEMAEGFNCTLIHDQLFCSFVDHAYLNILPFFNRTVTICLWLSTKKTPEFS